jgi:hypothetical protein
MLDRTCLPRRYSSVHCKLICHFGVNKEPTRSAHSWKVKVNMAGQALLQEPPDFSLVLGGPLYHLFIRTHLTGPALELLRRRIVIFCLVCWVPLALLSVLEGHLLGGAKFSFLRDIETHVRFLISLPVLLLAEIVVHRRLRSTVKSFIDRHIVSPEELPKFRAAIDSAIRMRNSVLTEGTLLVLVFTGGIWIWRNEVALNVASWYASPGGGQMHLTWAGSWFEFVSVPIFQFILLRWYVRMLIWFLFLLRVSHLRLQLLPANPDRAGGIGFLGRSTIAFTPLLFAQGALLTGQIANRIFYTGQSLLSFKLTIIGFVCFFVAVILVPLLVFTPQLWDAKLDGLAKFGSFAEEYVMDFGQKWLPRKANDEQLLGSADIQSLADLGNSYAVVREMRAVPFATEDVLWLLVASVVPMLPLLLTMMPLDQLVTEGIKMVF